MNYLSTPKDNIFSSISKLFLSFFLKKLNLNSNHLIKAEVRIYDEYYGFSQLTLYLG